MIAGLQEADDSDADEKEMLGVDKTNFEKHSDSARAHGDARNSMGWTHVPRKRKSTTTRRSSAVMDCLDWRTFSLLAAAVFVIFADQNLMAPNLTQVRAPSPSQPPPSLRWRCVPDHSQMVA